MTTTMCFHERMEGWFAAGESDPEVGAAKGEQAGTRLAFEVTITMDDLDAFIADPAHTADVTGFYTGDVAPIAGADSVAIERGTFNFMSRGPGRERLMEHHHTFVAGGKRYRFDGDKILEHHPLTWDEWGQLSTLYTRISDAATGEPVAAGVLHFPLRDTLKLVRSFEVRGSDDPAVARMKFLKLFLGDEAEVLLASLRPFDASAKRRSIVRPHAELGGAYDVVVVGSGYGGGVVASRLTANTGKAARSVCVLERGREWRAGDFPDEPWQIPAALRTHDQPLGLFELHFNEGIDALVGCGVGGTSLINASAMIRADPAVLKSAGWPRGLPDLAPYYERAEAVLAPVPHPSVPLKGMVFRDAAARTPEKPQVGPIPIAVTFERGARVDTGVELRACTGCGACVTGCNYGAKNTVDMTYLALAERQGARIFACIEVDTLERGGDGTYVVHARDLEQGGAPVAIRAKQVVLAAGSLGTYGILARSRVAHALAVSDQLGAGFSGNADILGFAYDGETRTQVTEGPTITSIARYAATADHKPFVVEEGGVPRALVPLVRAALPLARDVEGASAHVGIAKAFGQWLRVQADVLGFESAGALNHTLLFFGIGFEDTPGKLALRADGTVAIVWPDAAAERYVEHVDDAMSDIADAVGASYLDNPMSRQFLGRSLVTAHPIGGCAMADDAAKGVTSARGDVFGHEGKVFVADGSLFPAALGANPALTIAALAELIAEGIAQRWT